ncbi:MAG: Hpt domain-containing protein [Candidatus Competibacteraceae bacterium]|nr:Hpt domain-containing protein [Candidatus Competibacteraceae bacterium]
MATISSEITSALEAEVAALVEVLFETFSDPEAIEDSALIADGLGRYISHVEQLGILARQGGFMGFQQLCVQFQGRLTLLANEENALSDGHRELLEEWPSLVMGYLESPANAELSDALIAHLENPLWPSLLIEAEPSALREALIRPSDTGFEQDDDGANLVEAEAEAVAEPSLSEISHQKLEQVETELGSVFENSVDAEINAAALDTSELEERAFQESDATLPIAVATEAPASAEAALESHPLVDDLISALPTPMVVETPAEPLTANGFAELVAPDVEEMEGSEDVYLEGSAAEAVPVAPGVVPAVVHEDAFPEVQLAEREGQLADLASTVSKTVEALSEAEREAVVVSPQFLESDPILKSVAIESSDGETVWLEAEVEQPAMADSSIISESMGIAESVLEPTEAEVSQPKEVEIAEAAVESREEATAVFEAGVQSLLHPTAALLEPELEPALPSEDEITDEDGAAAGLPGFDQELVELLQGELGSIIEATEDLKGIVLAPETDTEARLEVLSNYADQIARLADAAEALGLGGLQQVCAHLNGNVMALAAWGRPLDESEYQLLAAWPERALHYLQKLPDRSCSRALVQSLIYANWPDPLPVELATPLVELLAKPTFAIPEEMAVEARPQEATPEDVSLALPEDVNPELLDSLLQELPGQTAELSAAIQRLAAGNGVLRDVEVAQRIAHTVKGAGNTVGVRGIANLTHHMEDILQAFSKHKALPTRRLAETLLAATDCLENMSEALVGLGAPPTQARQVLQSILDWANRIDREGLPRDDAALPERVPTVAAVQTGKLPELVDVAEAPRPLRQLPHPRRIRRRPLFQCCVCQRPWSTSCYAWWENLSF